MLALYVFGFCPNCFFFGLFVLPDRYKSFNLSDIVEEDDEVFFRSSSHSILPNKRACGVQNGLSESSDADLDLSKNGFLHGAASVNLKDGRQQKDSWLSAEPMKHDCSGLSLEGFSLLRYDFYPLDLQNWEDEIIWGNSPSASEDSHESSENSGSVLGPLGCEERETESGNINIQVKPLNKLEEKNHCTFLRSFPVSLEPFGSRDSSRDKTNSLSRNLFHPQLLRLGSRPEVDIFNPVDVRRENITGEHNKNGQVKHFTKLALQNQEMMDGSWVDKIIWDEDDKPIVKPKLIFDLQDDQMHFEVLDSKDDRHLHMHAGAMILTRSLKSSNVDSSELPGHGNQHGWRSIANDKHYSNWKTSQQLKSNSKKRSAHGVKVSHSQPAVKLQTMKLKLSK